MSPFLEKEIIKNLNSILKNKEIDFQKCVDQIIEEYKNDLKDYIKNIILEDVCQKN